MRKNWKTKTLGSICKISTGKSNANEAVENGEYAFFDRSKKVKRSRRFLFDCKALIIPGEGAEFFPRYYSGKFDLHQRAYALFNFDESVSIRFVEYYLIFDHKYFEQVAVGATAKSLRIRHFQELLIPLPLLPEQKRIVKILDELFEKIAKAKGNTEKNLQNARELFETYLQSVFANLGDEWGGKTLGEVCVIKPPKKETKEKLKDAGSVTFLPMKDLGILTKEINATKERQLKDVFSSYTYFADDDVLLAKITPCFENGKIGIARNLTNGVGFGSSEYIVFRSKGEIIPDYLYYFLTRNQFREEGKKLMTGAVGHKRISKDFIYSYYLPFPKSLFEQKAIVSKLDTLSAETKKLEAICQQKLVDLEELKKSILQKAFNGKLAGAQS
ncbi:MAG: restriction endonuclease subunit S [Candidatus Susulua stagnicola]|nr:restriction endonuclease subunit S [Candidatus Susulua stagnicola]